MASTPSESTQCVASLLEFGTSCSAAERQQMMRDAERTKNQQHIDMQEAKFEAEATILESLLETARTADVQAGPLQAYYNDMEAQKKALQEENYALQQQIRAGRRRFLDSDPQEGVLGIRGLQTSDDQIMLTFWIAFTLAILVGIVLVILKYGEAMGLTTVNQKVGLGVVLFLLAYLITYYFIYNYA